MALVQMIEKWRFRLLLTMLVATLFLETLLDENLFGALFLTTLFAIVLGGAVYVSAPPARIRYFAYGLVAIWMVVSWLRDSPVLATFDAPLLAITIVLGVTVFGITLRALIYSPEADIDALAGAVFGYFLLAVVWALFYMQLEYWTPGSFRFAIAEQDVRGELLYFSLVTITTLGYGDITAANPFARICTGVEAAQGTLYLAILVGRVVSLLKSDPR
ncbi:potassium channel family protein [Microbaculum marinum]|uniref:Potassium channel family protein n=1 Tax=Microbaculum marinum TaxID=1764581 RepID=A0AAW9RIU2_9HYPH